ncbi:O-antigen ligase family protein [Deinococcus budaensis]|uniref:O-antigen ligase-related domain-containing protein n=1 Tax=Deinococcus budaensis TaxID=1665626 RepID=A0A7W8LPV3_9DEIO|nr:O-antigen ligase family protein [Deinococcus budaensis]MBB5234094.1 hypothetical protein [Deinococcus budaensis]
MPNTWTTSPWALLALLGLLASALVVWQPSGAAPVMLGLGALLGLLALGRRLPGLALGFLACCLLGYALLGRGFAYLGAPPVFVGEMALALGLLALLLTGALRGLVAAPPLYPLLALLLTGAAATVPYVGVYGIDAFRDAALWGYGLFALIVAGLLLRGNRGEGRVLGAARGYVRYAPLFLLWMPVALVISELYADAIPLTPGSDVRLLDLKGGDVAVHLAGIAALLLLGLPRLLAAGNARSVALGRLSLTRTDWLWWALWFAAAAIPLFRVRAGLLAVAAVVLVVLLFRPGTRWWKPLVLVVLMVTSFVAFDVRITVGGARNTISAESLLLNIQSITQSTGEGDRDGSRRWRLLWWGDIVNYTVSGPYFWTGKGYGINLADADGYQLANGELRSPHNGHLTILARSGVPGLAAWVLLQGLFVFGLLRAYRRAAAAGQELWARLNLWVLAYWTAFMVNAAFDVFLEGPQGGIWFWALFGFGLALLELQRRHWKRQAGRPATPQMPAPLEVR